MALSGDDHPQPATPQRRGRVVAAGPRAVLRGWHEICAAVGLPHSQWRRLKKMNASQYGPILSFGPGRPPEVFQDELVGWWNSIERRCADVSACRADETIISKGGIPMMHCISVNVTIGPNGVTAQAPRFNLHPTGIVEPHRGAGQPVLPLSADGRITAPGGVNFRVVERAQEFVLHVEVDLLPARAVQSFAVTVVAGHVYRFSVAFDDGQNGRFVSWARIAQLDDDPAVGQSVVGDHRQVFRLVLPRPIRLDAA